MPMACTILLANNATMDFIDVKMTDAKVISDDINDYDLFLKISLTIFKRCVSIIEAVLINKGNVQEKNNVGSLIK